MRVLINTAMRSIQVAYLFDNKGPSGRSFKQIFLGIAIGLDSNVSWKSVLDYYKIES